MPTTGPAQGDAQAGRDRGAHEQGAGEAGPFGVGDEVDVGEAAARPAPSASRASGTIAADVVPRGELRAPRPPYSACRSTWECSASPSTPRSLS